MDRRRRIVLIAAICLGFSTPFNAWGQEIGDHVSLDGGHPDGVPMHQNAGELSFFRIENGTTGVVTAIDPVSGWILVDTELEDGWVTSNHVTVIAAGPDDPVVAAGEGYVVGAWNLEWLNDAKTRGFPENTNGGPTYPPRTDADYQFVAAAIHQLEASVLSLSEINGNNNGVSTELDRLVSHLGSNWAYQLGSGDDQRVAFLWNTKRARNDGCVELEVPEQKVQDKDIFDRDPLFCEFTLLDSAGAAKTDIAMVALHLASGQQLNVNHDAAMAALESGFAVIFADPPFQGERDVFLCGDMNASRYDSKQEAFWEGYNSDGLEFVTLSPTNGGQYPATRLSGVPLAPRSQIDYLIASGQPGGLVGNELVGNLAAVRQELLAGGYDDFRERASDHIPVTVRVRVVSDSD